MPNKLPIHQPVTKRFKAPENRPSPAKRGYDHGWRKFRFIYLNRHPLCIHCLAVEVTTTATEVDHIKTLRSGGGKYDNDNLQALCKSCHSKKTISERGGE